LPIGVPLSVLRLRKCETIMFSNFYNSRRSFALEAGRAFNAGYGRPWPTFRSAHSRLWIERSNSSVHAGYQRMEVWLREDASVALRRGKLIRMAH
jgi:hypothetical protein